MTALKHWFGKKEIPRPEKLQAFFNDITAVYLKHGLTISHEDFEGSFIIESLHAQDGRRDNLAWLLRASIDESAAPALGLESE